MDGGDGAHPGSAGGGHGPGASGMPCWTNVSVRQSTICTVGHFLPNLMGATFWQFETFRTLPLDLENGHRRALLDRLMQVTIWFPTGFTVAGVLVAGTNTELCVAMQNWDDIAVFRAAGDDWVAENGERVPIRPHPANSIRELQFFEMFVCPSARRDAAIPTLLNAHVPAYTN